jgi:hypothetical protein
VRLPPDARARVAHAGTAGPEGPPPRQHGIFGALPLVVAAAALAATLWAQAAGAQAGRAPQSEDSIQQADIEQAIARVKADPNLATERAISMLRWTETASDPWKVPWWILGLLTWLTQSTRLLMWVVVAVLLALFIIHVARLVQARGGGRRDSAPDAPTHVRDLDIRPESLPADVGAAARALWDRGQHRAALALLYRGLLSRLAHVHRVPIRDSSTEGDCLALARAHLPNDRRSYAARLVLVWQRGVYGGDLSDTPAVHGLCDGFASMLDGAQGATGTRGGMPAAEGP